MPCPCLGRHLGALPLPDQVGGCLLDPCCHEGQWNPLLLEGNYLVGLLAWRWQLLQQLHDRHITKVLASKCTSVTDLLQT